MSKKILQGKKLKEFLDRHGVTKEILSGNLTNVHREDINVKNILELEEIIQGPAYLSGRLKLDFLINSLDLECEEKETQGSLITKVMGEKTPRDYSLEEGKRKDEIGLASATYRRLAKSEDSADLIPRVIFPLTFRERNIMITEDCGPFSNIFENKLLNRDPIDLEDTLRDILRAHAIITGRLIESVPVLVPRLNLKPIDKIKFYKQFKRNLASVFLYDEQKKKGKKLTKKEKRQISKGMFSDKEENILVKGFDVFENTFKEGKVNMGAGYEDSLSIIHSDFHPGNIFVYGTGKSRKIKIFDLIPSFRPVQFDLVDLLKHPTIFELLDYDTNRVENLVENYIRESQRYGARGRVRKFAADLSGGALSLLPERVADFKWLFHMANVYRGTMGASSGFYLEMNYPEIFRDRNERSNGIYEKYREWYLVDVGKAMTYLVRNADNIEGLRNNGNILSEMDEVLKARIPRLSKSYSRLLEARN